MVSIKKIIFTIFSLLFLALFSCSTRIDGLVREGGSAEISLESSLEPRTLTLLQSLMGFMGVAPGAILDGESISRSMALAPGIGSVSLKNAGPAAIEGTISVSNLDRFLSGGDNAFISYSEDAGLSSLSIVLNKQNAPLLISRLSPELEGYLSALMAPVVLGETMTKQEYLDLVSSIYSRALANEIAASRMEIFLDFPRPLLEVTGGTSLGRRAEFSIPLADILVLEQPLRYELKW